MRTEIQKLRSEVTVSLFTILTFSIGIVIAAWAASTHGIASTTYTSLLIGFGLSVVVGFVIAGLVLNSRSRRMNEELR